MALKVRKLHFWDEFHEPNAGLPSLKWVNNTGAVWTITADRIQTVAGAGPDTARLGNVLNQTGQLIYFWSMNCTRVAVPFDMSFTVRSSNNVPFPTGGYGNSYRVKQTDTNLLLIRTNAGVGETNLVNVALAAALNTEYWYALDINFTTGAYILWRGTTDSPELDLANRVATGTDPAPLAGLANAQMFVRCDAGSPSQFDHMKVRGPDLTNLAAIKTEVTVTEGAGQWEISAVNDSATLQTFNGLSLYDVVEITVADAAAAPPVEYVEFTGWVEEMEIADAHAGVWRIRGRDIRAPWLSRQADDNIAVLTVRETIIGTTFITGYRPAALTQNSLNLWLTANDVLAMGLPGITRLFRAMPVFDCITELTKEGGTAWHHRLTRDRRWKVTNLWDASGITIDEATGLIVDLVEEKEGQQAFNQVRVFWAGGVATVNDGAAQSAGGHIRTHDVVDLRVQTLAEAQARGNWVLNNFGTQQRVFALTVAGYHRLYPGETFTLTLTSRGIVALTYYVLKRTISYPEPGLVTLLVAPATQRFHRESPEWLAMVARDAKQALALQT